MSLQFSLGAFLVHFLVSQTLFVYSLAHAGLDAFQWPDLLVDFVGFPVYFPFASLFFGASDPTVVVIALALNSVVFSGVYWRWTHK